MAKVRVVDVQFKEGTNRNGKAFQKWTLVDDSGTRASTFDKKLGGFITANKGQVIEATYEKSGDFTNLTDAGPVQDSAPAAGAPVGGDAAIRLEVLRLASTQGTPGDVLDAARRYLAFVTGNGMEDAARDVFDPDEVPL